LFTLAEARVLYELPQRTFHGNPNVRNLNLDRGYLSRILAGFARNG